MTASATQVLPAPETAFVLRVRLGPTRAWPDFLADCIRDQASIASYQLLPCGRRRDGKALRPIYAVADIEDFIRKVLAAVPAAGKTPVKPITLQIDRSRHWRINKFDQTGAPMAMLRQAFHTQRVAL